MTDPIIGIKNSQNGLSGKVTLVTGGSRGIGFAIAAAFASQGARVIIQARQSETLAHALSLLQAAGGNVTGQVVDVSIEEQAITSIGDVIAQFGSIDVLINNAGIYKTAPVEGHASSLWDETMAINLRAPFIYCREVLVGMKKSGWGRIINISSISGKHAEIHGAAYSASKFALIGLTQSLALELAASGVTVNAICPGWVATDLAKSQLSDPEWCKLNSVDPQESMELATLAVPQLRFIESDEVADLAVYLASESGRGITGQAINICGGMCLS